MKYTVSAWIPERDGHVATACLEIEGKVYTKTLWSGVYENCAIVPKGVEKVRRRAEQKGVLELAQDAVWSELGLARLPA